LAMWGCACGSRSPSFRRRTNRVKPGPAATATTGVGRSYPPGIGLTSTSGRVAENGPGPPWPLALGIIGRTAGECITGSGDSFISDRPQGKGHDTHERP
jgi:hypothetical protein